jgi:hypothetical protein
VLLFPTGQLQWHSKIPHKKQDNQAQNNQAQDNQVQDNQEQDNQEQDNQEHDNQKHADHVEDILEAPPNNHSETDKFVSLAQFFRYRLHIRLSHLDSNHLFLSGKLFQEYVCESWAFTEQKYLAQLKAKQSDLRIELYRGLADAVAHNVDTNLEDLGRRIILPSSFAGSTRHMQQQCQDVLAINHYHGGGVIYLSP